MLASTCGEHNGQPIAWTTLSPPSSRQSAPGELLASTCAGPSSAARRVRHRTAVTIDGDLTSTCSRKLGQFVDLGGAARRRAKDA